MSGFKSTVISTLSAVVILTPMLGMAFVNGSYTISPLVSELNLDKPGTVSTMVLDVLNEKDVKIKLQVRPKMWTINDAGGLEYLKEPVGFNLQKDLMINPREFELEPFQRKPIRFGIRRPVNLPDGEYRFQLAFEEVKLLPDFTQTMKQNGVTAVINTKTILASTVYVHAGQTTPKIDVPSFTCQLAADRQELSGHFQIENNGTRHGRLMGVVVLNKKDSSGQFLPEKQSDLNNGAVIVILPGRKRDWQEPLLPEADMPKLTTGQYRAEVTLMDERKQFPAVTKSCDIQVP